MTGARAWMGTAMWVGMMTAATGLWGTSAPVSAQQKPAATAPAATPAAPAGLGGNAARGRYLVENVAMCGECHSTRDQAGNIMPEKRLQGGALPIRLPWQLDPPVQVPRIAGLPGYSDAEALKLLMDGAMKRNGQQARAPMPRFHMTREDAADVIAFLRTQ